MQYGMQLMRLITAQESAQGRLTPPRAVTPVVDLPSNATPGLTEPSGPPYTPQECEDDHPNAQSLLMSDNNNVSTGCCGCPPTENLNNKLSTQSNVAKPNINKNDHLV